MGHRLSRIYTRTGDDGSTWRRPARGQDDARVASRHCRRSQCRTRPAAGHGAARRRCARWWCICSTSVRPGRRTVHPRPRRDPRRRCVGTGTAAGPLQRQPADVEGIHPASRWRGRTRHLARAPSSAGPSARRSPWPATTPCAARAQYLNRLSDLLFVLARVLARADGHGEALWEPAAPALSRHDAGLHPSVLPAA